MIALGSNVEEMYIEFTSAELGREKTTINKSALFGVEYQFKKKASRFLVPALIVT